VLRVSIQKRLGDFTLNADWTGDAPIVALVGPSGAGKTVTLQCIAGLMEPDGGTIQCGDRVLFDSASRINLRPQARRIGYVFQGYALFPHMTVAQNIAYGKRGSSRPDSLFGLDGLLGRYPSQLSGSQQQRVALARALASDPALLLLDEPLSALDAPLRRELRRELAALLRESRTPAVLVTHDLADAYHIADLVVLCEHGQTSGAVPKNDLLWNPASERVARLIGARNILRGTVSAFGADTVTLEWRGGRVDAARSPSHALHARPGDTLAFFVRPEYVRLIRKNRPVTDMLRRTNLFHGTIVGERDEGPTWTLYFKLDAAGEPSQGTYDLEIEIPKLVYERLGLAADRTWDVSIHPGSIQVLPSQ
jgi:molybdate transport system ATP-binding protein